MPAVGFDCGGASVPPLVELSEKPAWRAFPPGIERCNALSRAQNPVEPGQHQSRKRSAADRSWSEGEGQTE